MQLPYGLGDVAWNQALEESHFVICIVAQYGLQI
jgi:hypothetical protein